MAKKQNSAVLGPTFLIAGLVCIVIALQAPVFWFAAIALVVMGFVHLSRAGAEVEAKNAPEEYESPPDPLD